MCQVTHTNANGETVLHHAASYAASKCLAELASNVDVAKLVNAVNKDGHSALDLAVAATVRAGLTCARTSPCELTAARPLSLSPEYQTRSDHAHVGRAASLPLSRTECAALNHSDPMYPQCVFCCRVPTKHAQS